MVPRRPCQRTLFGRIRTPVLVVACGEDRTFPPDETEEMADLLAPLVSLIGDRKLSMKGAKAKQADLLVLKEMLEAGKIKPAIDRRYPLSEAAEAVRYLEAGHARGKVIVNVA